MFKLFKCEIRSTKIFVQVGENTGCCLCICRFGRFPFQLRFSGLRPTGRDACASAKQNGPLRSWISMQGALGASHVAPVVHMCSCRVLYNYKWICIFSSELRAWWGFGRGSRMGVLNSYIGKEKLEVMTSLNRKVYMAIDDWYHELESNGSR